MLTFGTDVRVTGGRASLVTNALGARAADGRFTGQALVTGAAYAPATEYARWQLAGTLSAFGLSNDLPTVSTQLVAREYVGTSAQGAFIGAGGGGIARAQLWRPAYVGQAGVWWHVAEEQLVTTLSVTRASTVREVQTTSGTNQLTSPASYIDLSAGWQHERGPITLAVGGGLRAATSGAVASDGWGSASAAAWIAPRVALVGTIGRALEDIVRGVPRARYASLAFRVALQPHASVGQATPLLARGPRLTIVGDGLDGPRQIEVRADSASAVEIRGDFTQWESVALRRVDDVWRAGWAIEPGPHRIAVRVDGGVWRAPVNLPRVDDGFGGVVGLITVP